MTYLNRNDVVDLIGGAHSIGIPNVEYDLYIPGVGLVEV
jgi:hypothetical protein